MNTPTPPNTLYRFRNTDALLDKYHELENQTIYFASPEELNDPMEGVRDIVWRGDKIVWTNFFKHYVYCLHFSQPFSIADGYSSEFDSRTIPITGRWDQLPTNLKSSFNGIWRGLLKLSQIQEIITALSSTNRKIRYREMEKYLQVIRLVYIILYLQSLSGHSLSNGSTFQVAGQVIDEMSESLEIILEIIPTWIAESDTSENERGSNAALGELENDLRKATARSDFQTMIHRIESLNPAGDLAMSRQPMPRNFPKMYLREIERLLWPNWYVACFMKDYHNSSVWGHYGAGHKGVCLIFETEIMDGLHNLRLYETKMTGEGKKGLQITKRPFRKVRYTVKPGETDFFRSIGRLTGDELKKLWYTDDEGNESECGDHILSNGAASEWEDSYRDRFYRDITAKTKDWKYEQEYRLILEDASGVYTERESRTIDYTFKSLKGIIFGIKTSDKDKSRIIEIIQRRCRETSNRTDFKYYQAYYSPETGDIRKDEMDLSLLD